MKKKTGLVLLLIAAMAGAAFAQNYVNKDQYKYWISQVDNTYRTLTIQTRTDGYRDDLGFIELVRCRYSGDPKIVEIVQVYDKKEKNYHSNKRQWKVGEKATIEEIMKDSANVGEYRIRTPAGYFVEFGGMGSWGEPDGILFKNIVSDRSFGVILPGSSVLIAGGNWLLKIEYGAVGWDEEFLAVNNLEEFMQYLAEKVNYKWLTGMVDALRVPFELAEKSGLKKVCPMPVGPFSCGVCKGDIAEHIIMNATQASAGWGALWGFAPAWLMPAEFIKVHAQFTAQAYLAAAIGYLYGKYPKGGDEFTKQLKIDNYVLFAGKDSKDLDVDTVLLGMTDQVRDNLIQESATIIMKHIAPKFVDTVPVIGTVWGVASGAYNGAKDAQKMGRRAVDYYKGKFSDFIFHPYTGEITKYNGKDKALKIPKLINGSQVLVIGEKAFENNKAIESVTFEDVNTRTINARAFAGCSSLKDIAFPQNQAQMTIGENAFANTSLNETTKIKLREFGYKGAGVGQAPSVKVTFEPNGGKLNESVTKLLTVGSKYGAMPVVSRSGYTFSGWRDAASGGAPIDSGTTVIIAKDHKLYAHWALDIGPDDPNQPVTMDKLTFDEIKGQNAYAAKKGNNGISGTVVIPAVFAGKPVTAINGSAFSGLKELSRVFIPASVTTIKAYAFNGCEKLLSVTFVGKVADIDKIAFPGDLGIKHKDGGAGTYTRQAGENNWTKQGLSTAKGQPTMDKLTFAETKEGYEVKQGNLKVFGEVVIPPTFAGKPVSIASSAFSGNGNINSVTILNGVTAINRLAFSGCKKLTGITIPASVKEIKANAFYNCPDLTSVTFQGRLTDVEINAFQGNLALKYKDGGAGTYTREAGKNEWTKK